MDIFPFGLRCKYTGPGSIGVRRDGDSDGVGGPGGTVAVGDGAATMQVCERDGARDSADPGAGVGAGAVVASSLAMGGGAMGDSVVLRLRST